MLSLSPSHQKRKCPRKPTAETFSRTSSLYNVRGYSFQPGRHNQTRLRQPRAQLRSSGKQKQKRVEFPSPTYLLRTRELEATVQAPDGDSGSVRALQSEKHCRITDHTNKSKRVYERSSRTDGSNHLYRGSRR